MSDAGLRPGVAQGFAGSCMDAFAKALREMGLAITEEDAGVVRAWLEFYSHWPGRRVIGFADPKDIAVKLLADSHAVLRLREAPEMGPTIDLGSGNGWPGLAFHSRGEVFLLDSRAGACDFMRGFVESSGLTGVQVVEARAEEAGRRTSFASAFRIVTSRAMAAPSIVAEVSAPFLVIEGSAILWLGPSHRDLVIAHADIPQVGLSLIELDTYFLPGRMGERILAVYRKTAGCHPGFPRNPGEIRAKPLF